MLRLPKFSVHLPDRRDWMFALFVLLACIGLCQLPTGYETGLYKDSVRAKAVVLSTDDSKVHQFGIVRQGNQDLRIRIEDTRFAGRELDANNTIMGKLELDKIFRAGDQALVVLDTDPQTGEVLREYNGQPVTPVAYPYQMITYRQDGAQIFADVEQGAGRAVQTIKARDGIRYRWIGADTLAVTAPIFLDFPLPGGARYEAWENYDFFIHQGGKVAEPHQMSWQRFGSLPPWAGKGKAIYHLLSWRVEDQNQFPPMILAWAKAAMPMWLIPPADVAEVRKLQQGEAVEGWAK